MHKQKPQITKQKIKNKVTEKRTAGNYKNNVEEYSAG